MGRMRLAKGEDKVADTLMLIALVLIGYSLVCLLIATVRTLFFEKSQKKQRFRETFWPLFVEVLNPLNWIFDWI